MRKQLDAQQSLGVQTKETLGLVYNEVKEMRLEIVNLKTETNARFDSVNARFDSAQTETAARFDSVNARLDSAQTETDAIRGIVEFTSEQVAHIRTNITDDFEGLCAAWITSYTLAVHQVEIPFDALKFRELFSDTKGIIKPSENGRVVNVEIDIFCASPVLVAAELTWVLGSGKARKSVEAALVKVDKFVQKIKFLELELKERPLAFFVCPANLDRKVLEAIKKPLAENKIILINFDGIRTFNKVKI